MRILVVCAGGYTYGKESVTFSLIQGLLERDHETMVVTTTWSNGEFERRLNNSSIPHQKLPLGFVSKTFSTSAITMTLDQMRKLPRLWYGYRKCLRQFNPDVVIHSTFHHVCLLWPLFGKEVNVFHVHDSFPPTTFYRKAFRIVNRRISKFIGVSKFVADTLRDIGIPGDKIATVLNGVAVIERINQNGNGSGGDAGDNLKKQQRPIRIGIVGQVAERKGHEDLIEALMILEEKGRPFLCRIFGDGNADFVAQLKSKIERNRLTNRVEWMGFVSSRESIYDQIDVCVVPSRFAEPFGLVAAEAAAYGLPVVATRRGGLSELILDKQTGYIVDAKSPTQLADKLFEVSASSEFRTQMGRQAKSHALKTLTANSMTEGIETVLKRLIDNN